MLSALIVEDEPLARAHLRRMLEQQAVRVVGEAENATQGLQMAEDLHPQLVFLDIQMPGVSGMQIASAILHLENPPCIIFCTGYSEYAVAAFEHDTLDYLLKPVAPERLAKTLLRARERLANGPTQQEAQPMVAQRAEELPLRRLPVREDYTVRLVRVEDILCAVARNKRVFVQTRAGEQRTYYTLTQLETLLPDETFLRIHDSCIANLEHIEELLFLGNHSYAVRLSTGLQLPVGRTRYAELQRRLGLKENTNN